ncbi:hypothetical protein [Halobaculum gomorrense]|uniref:hypothetical protein n=1 Tax=Halobaculum gomorrense TaxID=43928 RepID=UPI000934FA76|nr:hypothetical protein [Halobaculum gomorrense]
MRRPLHGDRGVPDPDDVSVGPTVAVSVAALATFVAFAFPLVGAALAGAVAAAVGRTVLAGAWSRLGRRRRRRVCLPGTRACVEV